MAKVIGVGGVFFKSRNPEKLGTWYRECLGVPVEHPHGASFEPHTMPIGSRTVWAPFKKSTDYFEPSQKEFMFNLVVDDLDGALTQVAKAGGRVIGEVEEYEYGRFGWFVDPEGNKVELWEAPPIGAAEPDC